MDIGNEGNGVLGREVSEERGKERDDNDGRKRKRKKARD